MKEKKQKKQSVDTEIATEDGIVEIKKPNKKELRLAKNRQKYIQKYFTKFSGRAQESYDEMLKVDYQKMIERALELSSINEMSYSSVMMITIPDAFDQTSKVNYRLDKKEDGTFTLLYDQALVTILFFGDDVLYYYQGNVDHRNGHIAYDVSGEFNYFDVVHMETALKYDRPVHPKYLTLDLEIGLTDGTMVPFHLRNHRIHDDYDLKTLLTDQEKKLLDTLKQKVRESRQL
jgi:hypothetical protein